MPPAAATAAVHQGVLMLVLTFANTPLVAYWNAGHETPTTDPVGTSNTTAYSVLAPVNMLRAAPIDCDEMPEAATVGPDALL